MIYIEKVDIIEEIQKRMSRFFMIEELFKSVVSGIREYINTNRKENTQDAEKFLRSILSRLDFLNDDGELKILKQRLIREMVKFSKSIFSYGNNVKINKKIMQRNIDNLAWINEKNKLNKQSIKYTVAQREIFYAKLGNNIGSEQNGRRPVMILQNNVGNAKANTTIIAPVTTHQKQIQYDRDAGKYYIERIKEGMIVRKYLDFYEIPLRLEGNTTGLYGFVNVMHLREIDRKRIDGKCVGKATEECYRNVISAINKNL